MNAIPTAPSPATPAGPAGHQADPTGRLEEIRVAALAEIRDGRLYLEVAETFEEYCRDRWGMDRTYAHRLMAAASVVQVLLPMGNIIPSSERQTRPLITIPLEQEANDHNSSNSPAPARNAVAPPLERPSGVRAE